MFERYTESARRVIFFARYEASQLGAGAIDTEHLLLALFRQAPELMARLAPEGVTPDSGRRAVEAHTGAPRQKSTRVDIPLTTASKRVLMYAAKESDELGSVVIDSEHLLLGLADEKGTLARQLFPVPQPKLEELRAELRDLPESRRRLPPTSLSWTFRHRQWFRLVHNLLAMFFALLVFQVIAKTITHELFRNAVALYASALAGTACALLVFTVWLRQWLVLPQRSFVRLAIVIGGLCVLSACLLIRALYL